ncbi:DUF2169 domain-containing protein [Trinickia caryophylli]|uniref:DUF2169 domain-containing protein n=1 Tax=Trinickia caryophylli TaxID=28094 RepID=A0A1X7D5S4_TRICW|nr:DUF2169 domain-containing protein [Trinickia caryophylli]PMS12715.1 DUF2169 domain-containing protein [Trinickia caryophylli]TRX15120.1 DUF2169 domain-containing protein [Trinickia caryophylli]WQE14981.1 DUF2169 domain-containing protein [Trinickia caryophylli]SMF09173.1 hypothetical protein SAMN06295900_102416 [Trinickia caryophylli]GLU31290.1 hypothetical protein Busp01_11320 [Trinickia caryophylli]
MKVIKPLTLGVLTRSCRIGGARRFVVSALGFFPLGVSVQRFATESEQWPVALAALAEQGIAQPLDEVFAKPRAEWLVAGSAHAPNGVPVARMRATVRLAHSEKTLEIVGERAWRYAPWLVVDEPQPFVSMPLGYANAFGGPGYRRNPLGRGYDGNRFAALVGANTAAMPNLERPGEPVRRHWKRYAPASFAPLAFEWPQRVRHAGRYGRHWLENEAPGFPSSASPRVFQRAPDDQWLDGFLQGGEPYRLLGLHPTRPEIVGCLPALAARAFIRRRGADSIEPVPLVFDTVWFFPDRELGLALFHGEAAHADPLGFDIDAVMVGYEHKDRARPLAHYADVFAKRCDPAVAMAHVFNESELAADYDAPTLAARADAAAERAAAAEAALAARRQARQAAFGLSPHAAGAGSVRPRHAGGAQLEAGARLPVPDGVAIAESDFDLGPTFAAAKALIVQAQEQADALRAALPELAVPSASADLTTRREQAFARASEAAPDLLDMEAGGGTMGTIGTRAANADARPAEGTDALDAMLTRQARQQRAARRARMRYVDPDGPLPSDLARWLGEQVYQWHRAGVSLAGRDLSGIDLSGFDLSGADLREVQLENADLRGTRLAGARLDRAALTGARLDGADLRCASLVDANLSHGSAKGAVFAGADLGKAWAVQAVWSDADLSGASLERCLAYGIDLSRAILCRVKASEAVLIDACAPSSDWREATLGAVVLMRAKLDGAVFALAAMRKVVLVGASLAGASFEGAALVDVVASGTDANWRGVRAAGLRAEHCSWHQAQMQGSGWDGASISASDFGRADLSGATLADALLANCLFTGATLRGIRGERADLFRAVCRGADLSDASLAQASLYQTDFADALMARADLSGARHEAGRKVAA